MTWYEWVVGGFQFVGMWWLTDKVLHRRKQPEAVERRRVRYEARRYEIANIGITNQRRQNNYCTRCYAMLWESPPGLCKRCRSAARERGKPPPSPALDFSRYEPPGIYGSVEAVQLALESKKDEIKREYERVLRQQSKMM